MLLNLQHCSAQGKRQPIIEFHLSLRYGQQFHRSSTLPRRYQNFWVPNWERGDGIYPMIDDRIEAATRTCFLAFLDLFQNGQT